MGFLSELFKAMTESLAGRAREKREERSWLWRDAFADPGGDMQANQEARDEAQGRYLDPDESD